MSAQFLDSSASSISERTAADYTAHSDDKTRGGAEGIFSEPESLPLPDAGHHHLGVVFEGLTVHGTGGAQRTVEGLEISLLQVRLGLNLHV